MWGNVWKVVQVNLPCGFALAVYIAGSEKATTFLVRFLVHNDIQLNEPTTRRARRGDKRGCSWYRHVIKYYSLQRFTEICISNNLWFLLWFLDSCHDSLIPAKIPVIPKAIDVIRNRGGPLALNILGEATRMNVWVLHVCVRTYVANSLAWPDPIPRKGVIAFSISAPLILQAITPLRGIESGHARLRS